MLVAIYLKRLQHTIAIVVLSDTRKRLTFLLRKYYIVAKFILHLPIVDVVR